METRELTPTERGILDLLLTRSFPGRDALLSQATTVRTTGLSCTCGCPSFSLKPDQTLPHAEVTDRMPSGAHGTDPGGNEIGVLLFVEDGYLFDVEVFSYEEPSAFAGLPDPSALKLSEWSTPDEGGARHLLNP
jgi:hypothetical protein